MVFDTTVGDLFTVRVGANVVNDDILGSLEIAAESGARVLLVLGHTDCGGIKAAIGGWKLGHFTQLVEKVKPAIDATNARLDQDSALAREVGERVAGNSRYIAEASHTNAVQSKNQILERSPVLKERVSRGQLLGRPECLGQLDWMGTIEQNFPPRRKS